MIDTPVYPHQQKIDLNSDVESHRIAARATALNPWYHFAPPCMKHGNLNDRGKMTIRDDEKWILTENLKRAEQEERARVERGEDRSGNDFGAYHALLTRANTEWVSMHAVMDAAYFASYLKQLANVISDHFAPGKPEATLLDVGCGPGFLTHELAAGLKCRAMGIDISESGIQYALRQFPDCRFAVVAVDKNMELGERFNVVHAREFYPFTRTASVDFHSDYIEALSRHVSDGGVMVLTLLSQPKSLASNADALAPQLARLGMTPFKRIILANTKLPSWIPLPLAKFVTALGMRLAGRPPVEFYVSRKQSRPQL